MIVFLGVAAQSYSIEGFNTLVFVLSRPEALVGRV